MEYSSAAAAQKEAFLAAAASYLKELEELKTQALFDDWVMVDPEEDDPGTLEGVIQAKDQVVQTASSIVDGTVKVWNQSKQVLDMASQAKNQAVIICQSLQELRKNGTNWLK